jgi:hypothetical protein
MGVVPDRYCFDLNDAVLTPGDTICYVLCAEDGLGNRNYWTRRQDGQGSDFVTDDLQEALNSPCEFTILPAAGQDPNNDILYVDDADDRGDDTPQLYFDTSLQKLGVLDMIDRYDVLGPSTCAGNSLGSRVVDVFQQIIPCYRKIIWNTADLEVGLIGDGGVPNGGSGAEKSDDYFVLFTFLDQHPNGGGLYLSGDDIAERWVGHTGASAIAAKSTYMHFNLGTGNHVALGEPVSPLLEGVSGGCFDHSAGGGDRDSLVAWGGCPAINDFDLLTPTGDARVEMHNPNTQRVYVISEVSQNTVGDSVGVILSGFSFHYIRDDRPQDCDDRTHHLMDVIEWLDNPRPTCTGIEDGPLFANYIDNNYPNPFNPETTIRFGIKEPGHVSLRVYDVSGRLVRTLVNGEQTPRAEGFAVRWDGRNNEGNPVASGVYFYKLITKNFTKTKKMVLLK